MRINYFKAAFQAAMGWGVGLVTFDVLSKLVVSVLSPLKKGEEK